jgi:hypothetical protein
MLPVRVHLPFAGLKSSALEIGPVAVGPGSGGVLAACDQNLPTREQGRGVPQTRSVHAARSRETGRTGRNGRTHNQSDGDQSRWDRFANRCKQVITPLCLGRLLRVQVGWCFRSTCEFTDRYESASLLPNHNDLLIGGERKTKVRVVMKDPGSHRRAEKLSLISASARRVKLILRGDAFCHGMVKSLSRPRDYSQGRLLRERRNITPN